MGCGGLWEFVELFAQIFCKSKTLLKSKLSMNIVGEMHPGTLQEGR